MPKNNDGIFMDVPIPAIKKKFPRLKMLWKLSRRKRPKRSTT